MHFRFNNLHFVTFLGDQCPYDQFMCESDSTCIPLSWHCNGVPDCQDQSDELNCSKSK